MNRKVLVAAIAAAFTAPAAFAQSSVTIGGTINIMWDSVKAGNASAGAAGNIKSHDRVRDGSGSNIRFTVIEDLGGGNSAYVQVESAVIQNSDQRNDAVGNTAFNGASGNAASVWGNRNTGIGFRSKTAGRFIIGVWDVHYHNHYAIDPGWLIANSAGSTLSLTNNMGSPFAVNPTFGGRFSNTLIWNSPVWSGFSMDVTYSRPTDGVPVNSTGSVRDGKVNRAWSFSPRYERGGLAIVYSYLQDKDANTTATLIVGGPATSVWKITSNRLGARYKFANGLGIGALWDQGKVQANHETGIAGTSVKRDVWAFPITWDSGNHHVYGTYARAKDWKGNVAGTGVNTVNITAGGQVYNLGNDTGAKHWTIGYAYNLSQRTNVHISYQTIRNDALVRYDGFANGYGMGAGNVGADPKSFSAGIRHTW